MQKGSALPFLLIVVLILGALGYWYVSKKEVTFQNPVAISSKTSDVYTNSSLGFELETNLKVVEDSEEDFNKRGNGEFRKNFKGYVGYEPGKVLGVVAVLDKSESFDQNPLSIWVFANPDNLDIDKWYGNFWYFPFVWGDFTFDGRAKVAPVSEATVSGQLAKFGVVDHSPGKPKFVYIAKNGKMYLFRIIGDGGEKILSTFKFL